MNIVKITVYIESTVTFTYNLLQCESFLGRELFMPTNLSNETKKVFIEVWEDVIAIPDLVISVIITVSFTMILYALAPERPPFPLIFGLIGALFGFGLSVFLIKPKRTVTLIKSKEDK